MSSIKTASLAAKIAVTSNNAAVRRAAAVAVMQFATSQKEAGIGGKLLKGFVNSGLNGLKGAGQIAAGQVGSAANAAKSAVKNTAGAAWKNKGALAGMAGVELAGTAASLGMQPAVDDLTGAADAQKSFQTSMDANTASNNALAEAQTRALANQGQASQPGSQVPHYIAAPSNAPDSLVEGSSSPSDLPPATAPAPAPTAQQTLANPPVPSAKSLVADAGRRAGEFLGKATVENPAAAGAATALAGAATGRFSNMAPAAAAPLKAGTKMAVNKASEMFAKLPWYQQLLSKGAEYVGRFWNWVKGLFASKSEQPALASGASGYMNPTAAKDSLQGTFDQRVATASWPRLQSEFEFLFKTAVGPLQSAQPQAAQTPVGQNMQAPSAVPEPVRPNYDELRDAQLKLLEAKKHDEFVKWEKDQQKSEIEQMKLNPDGAAIVGLAEQQNPGADITLDAVHQTAQRAQQQHAQHVQMNPMAAGESLGQFISQSSQNPNSPQANPSGFVANNAAARRMKMGSFDWIFAN